MMNKTVKVEGMMCQHCVAHVKKALEGVDGVEEAVEEKLGEKVWRVEGKQTGLWVAMDYMDVVVHIFTTELRSFYKLEELWADAPLKRYDYEE